VEQGGPHNCVPSFLDLLESNTLSLDAARMLFHVERSSLELVPEIQRIHENVAERSVQLTPIRAWRQAEIWKLIQEM